jgi:hypothetical protein
MSAAFLTDLCLFLYLALLFLSQHISKIIIIIVITIIIILIINHWKYTYLTFLTY